MASHEGARARERPGDPPGTAGPPRAAVYLVPGRLHAASEPTAITTVLGSCVAVCLHDPLASVGGMNHYLLPWPAPHERSARFGSIAIESLLESVLRLGAHQPRLRA